MHQRTSESCAQQSYWVFKPCKKLPGLISKNPPLANYWFSVWFPYCSTTYITGHKQSILRFQNNHLCANRYRTDGLQADQTWACVSCTVGHQSCLVVRWQVMGLWTSRGCAMPSVEPKLTAYLMACCLGAQQGLFLVSQRHWLLRSAALDAALMPEFLSI